LEGGGESLCLRRDRSGKSNGSSRKKGEYESRAELRGPPRPERALNLKILEIRSRLKVHSCVGIVPCTMKEELGVSLARSGGKDSEGDLGPRERKGAANQMNKSTETMTAAS